MITIAGHPDHPVHIQEEFRRDGRRSQQKYVYNVLKHVLGYGYKLAFRGNEGWGTRIPVSREAQDTVEEVLSDRGSLRPDGLVVDTELSHVANVATIRHVLAGPARCFADYVTTLVQNWDKDFHGTGIRLDEYVLIDLHGGVFVGWDGTVIHAKTAYRWAEQQYPSSLLPDDCRALRAAERRCTAGHKRI